ncbi:hypothetical protein GYMLUDRAFT_982397 [Collybiopsis luxurians FD-317 M1]|uniref:DNA topoisomerase (ATP-hydrolyzing) n=1 Tax=Collybiopsis luxurians FD-317 M1 TaxID=944289 RepID=A0A0D0BNX1_9AGAR|nr:hypothetical protein GYMLUDRAFT_982397 [Collybiopsis luxurians FD-317 M1]
MIMTDQDHNGSHIKGLLINFLDHFYPSLLEVPDFLVEFVMPIVRVLKGKQHKDFFTILEYEQWLKDTPGADKWESKYFKGLGTSTDADACGYFSDMAKHEGDRELIKLAFSKKKADDRKEWLRQFKEIPYSEFVHKELILFSMADNVRSIPSVADGLKPGQRKIIWACFKRNLKKEIKGHATHCDMSLTQTIVALAQDFVSSNNLNLMFPSGQFRMRDQGGKDHASGSCSHGAHQQGLRYRNYFNPIDIVLNIHGGEDSKAKLSKPRKTKITKLPIHKWTQTFKGELEAMMTGGKKTDGSVKNYQEHHANENIHFVVQMDAKEVAKAEEKGLLEYFKLISKVSTSNMICFNLEGKIRKYKSPEVILEEFYPSQLSYYQK